MSAAAAAPPAGAMPPAPSCFSEWLSRTPLVCKSAILLTTVPSLLSMLFGFSGALLLFPRSIFYGQVWRFVTAPFVQGDFIGVLFCAVVFAIQTPPSELRVGSLAFFLHLAISSAIINVIFVLAAGALSTLPWVPLTNFLLVPGNGAWPVLIMMLSERALADPAGSTPFCCFSIPNPFFGWALALFFSLFAFFPMLDMFIAVGIAHAHNAGALNFLKPSPQRLELWETTAGSILVRLGITRTTGYVFAPTSVLPFGLRDVSREAMSQFWDNFSLQRAMSGRPIGDARRADAPPNEPESGVRAGSIIRTGASRTAASGPSSSWSGVGHSLTSSSSDDPSSAAASARAGASSEVDAETRRRAILAATEARLSGRPFESAPVVKQPPAGGLGGRAHTIIESSALEECDEDAALLTHQPPSSTPTNPWSRELELLVEMGYQRDSAAAALQRANGNIDGAVSTLV